MNTSISPKTLRANGLDIAYLECGARSNRPLVICLHGFPDTAWSFTPVLDKLADAGFRAVAPFLRGYSPTEMPADGDVRWNTLATDLIEFVRELSPERPVYVVGHDWGSIIAQLASKQEPQLFKRLVLCAVPHLRRFLLFPSLAQIRRSHYIFRFQAPLWAERRMPRDDFAWIKDTLIRRWSPNWPCSDAALQSMVASFREPLRLKAAIDYYRGLQAALLTGPLRRLVLAPIKVPTMMVFGSDDGCIGADMFDRQESMFPAGLVLREAKGLGHFMQAEAPDWFAGAVCEYLALDTPDGSRRTDAF